MNPIVQMVVFFIFAVPAFVGSVLAAWFMWARYVGRIGTGLTMLVGGAAVNASFLISGATYADFADDAKFAWVTNAWRAVVGPNPALYIGLLIAFEAVVGILILSGGWPTRVGLIAAIAFHVGLGLFFTTFLTYYAAIMIVGMGLLLWAELRPEHAASARRLTHRIA
ncbi:hypothetical protein SCMU_10580 [Sinomonas cyclohexanicum]|uniref:PrsW family intramembrane metalloprotease n=1 Tax=Sinomonas cyclohexanicum TaxID=322009 RepID=A0ABN6FEJ8_SINCY|nr:hypothetical protein [Corynebacterium cyclohexanicum]BCT75216.1 hypothetical protein SCMU_10580 [Corynebacterium cyclohexanicum]